MLDTAWIRACAQGIGFELCGFAKAQRLEGGFLWRWLGEGLGEGMPWLKETAHLRLDIGQLLPGVETIAVLGCSYYHPSPPSKIARYARSRDYHKTFRGWLKALMVRLKEAYPGMAMRAFVDSGPVLEKVWAVQAGLGFVGKNGCFISRGKGSWLLLGVLLLGGVADIYGEGAREGCGACRACIEACPTGAILEGKRVDARRCLSFHSIENRGPWPEAVRAKAGAWLFGCDACQEVCPYNRSPPLGHKAFEPRPFAFWPVERFLELDEASHGALLGTPLLRAKPWGLRRNAAYVLGAAKGEGARALLQASLQQPQEPVVQEALAWALREEGLLPTP